MTFTLAEFLGGGFIACAASIIITMIREKKARREEVEEVRGSWATMYEETDAEWREQLATLKESVTILNKENKNDREAFETYRASARREIEGLERDCDHYREGLQKIANRQYLQIGQMSAPGATFQPPWEMAEEYLKGKKP